MKSSFTLLALAIAVVATGLTGCGSEPGRAPLAPDSTRSPARIVAFEPVPTDLVVAIDVSDSTSAEELSAVVGGLLANFADGEVFDQTGSASVAILAFGDTTAAVVESLTPLDPTSVDEQLRPVLEGLETARPVTGSSAVLDEALVAGTEILAGGLSGNAHMVVIGGGQDVDAAAVDAACEVLGEAGIRLHALGLDAAEAGAALLLGCAETTGGAFLNVSDTADVAAALRGLLSRITVVRLELLPDAAEMGRGGEHAVTATLTRGLDDATEALENLDVIFEVSEGPSAGLADTLQTAADGEAVFTLTGDVDPGTDVIVARADHPDGDVTLTATATVTWLNQAPDCDAGGPYSARVESDSVRVRLDAGGSSDAEGDELAFSWSVDGEGLSLVDADSAVAELILTGAASCADSVEVTLEVSDGFDTSVCTATVVVEDTRPPVLIPREEPVRLWPPNHRMHVITPEMTLAAVEDACDAVGFGAVRVLSVSSDESFDALGSGNSAPDVRIACDGSVELRAERSGGSDGRVYTILYEVEDSDGLAADLEVQVHVPHDQAEQAALAGEAVELVEADCPTGDR